MRQTVLNIGLSADHHRISPEWYERELVPWLTANNIDPARIYWLEVVEQDHEDAIAGHHTNWVAYLSRHLVATKAGHVIEHHYVSEPPKLPADASDRLPHTMTPVSQEELLLVLDRVRREVAEGKRSDRIEFAAPLDHGEQPYALLYSLRTGTGS